MQIVSLNESYLTMPEVRDGRRATAIISYKYSCSIPILKYQAFNQARITSTNPASELETNLSFR